MFEAHVTGLADSPMPATTFPVGVPANPPSIQEQLWPLLVNSDPDECNKNLSMFFKLVMDDLKSKSETYHACLMYALQLLNLNLFVKNFQVCLGKILGLMGSLSEPVPGDNELEARKLKEMLLILLLLLLKLREDSTVATTLDQHISDADLFSTLELLGMMGVVANFIASHIEREDSTHTSYVMLKLNCDIVFQYLYHVVLLSDEEFANLTDTQLIPALITGLLSNDNFNNYELNEDDFQDERKLIAYEEIKLLLLVNEQYMMKSLTCNTNMNRVFDGLLSQGKDSINGICGFTNLLVYHMNREESHIIKILMLKFLYLIFTLSYSAKLPYLNDMKILVDIFIRELNDNTYSSDASKCDGSILALTYLKVLYPMLTFSELSELDPSYKAREIVEVLRNVVVNCDICRSDFPDDGSIASQDVESLERASNIVKAAVKCLDIAWLKRASTRATPTPFMKQNGSSESLDSVSRLTCRYSKIDLGNDRENSAESLSFTKVASVRTASKRDFHKHTTVHNLEDARTIHTLTEGDEVETLDDDNEVNKQEETELPAEVENTEVEKPKENSMSRILRPKISMPRLHRSKEARPEDVEVPKEMMKTVWEDKTKNVDTETKIGLPTEVDKTVDFDRPIDIVFETNPQNVFLSPQSTSDSIGSGGSNLSNDIPKKSHRPKEAHLPKVSHKSREHRSGRSRETSRQQVSRLLDLPKEYLKEKALPPLPGEPRAPPASSSRSIRLPRLMDAPRIHSSRSLESPRLPSPRQGSSRANSPRNLEFLRQNSPLQQMALPSPRYPGTLRLPSSPHSMTSSHSSNSTSDSVHDFPSRRRAPPPPPPPLRKRR